MKHLIHIVNTYPTDTREYQMARAILLGKLKNEGQRAEFYAELDANRAWAERVAPTPRAFYPQTRMSKGEWAVSTIKMLWKFTLSLRP